MAVMANEFFDSRIGRIGGFGMNTKMVGDVFRNYDLGVSVIYVFASQRETPSFEKKSIEIHGWPMVSAWTGSPPSTSWTARYLAERQVDVAILIDFRDTYVEAVAALPPEVPVILWAQDPRTRYQMHKIRAIRDPAKPTIQAPGLNSPDATGVRSAMRGRRMATAVPWMPLKDRLPSAYGYSFKGEPIFELPNVLDVRGMCGGGNNGVRSTRQSSPSVLYLARLDPYKRPWLALEVAKAYPEVEFHFAGRAHFGEFYNFSAFPLPTNVKHYEHADGALKTHLLKTCWFLLSTSAHEGLAISYLEALACGMPILATVDPGGLVSQFGVYVGEYPGSGVDGLAALKRGFDRLLGSSELRNTLAERGRRHVVSTHNARRFARSFADIVGYFGITSSSLHAKLRTVTF